MAVPPRIPHQIQRRPVADGDPAAKGTNDGVPGQLYQHTSNRNSMLGNTWHVPTAIWLLFLILLSTNTQAIPVPVQYSNIEKMAAIWKATATPWGPADHSTPRHNMPQFDWTQHLNWTRTHYERGHQPRPIDPTLHWAIQQQRHIPNIQQVRQDIIHEIQTLTTEWDDVTQQWFKTLPDHCKSAYQQPHMITQIPVLHHLLTIIQYPHADILLQELTTGFSLIGQPQPGLNWKVRTDNKTQLESTHRQQIHRDTVQNRTTYLQPTIHIEETTTGSR